MRAWSLLFGALLAPFVACANPAKNADDRGHWEYVVDAPAKGASVLSVEATFERAGTPRLAIDERAHALIRDFEIVERDGRARAPALTKEGWSDEACRERCTIRYTIDLAELAHACDDGLDCGMKVDDAFVGPSLVWLVHPAPRGDVPATLRVRSTRPFAVGMFPRDGDPATFDFRSVNADEGAFAAFGELRTRELTAPGKNKRISLSIVGKQSLTDDQIATWVKDASALVSSVSASSHDGASFPVDRAHVFVAPVPGDAGITFGKVLSLTGASVGLVLGAETKPSQQHEEWVLVHEFFHLGFPSFRGEGRFLGEGIAVYYEPVLRARFGWISDEVMWKGFCQDMPDGQPPRGSAKGLVARDDRDAIYSGGSMFFLFADVKIREQTRGKMSLDDVVAAILSHGGNATHVMTVSDVMKIGDDATGTHVLADLYEHHAISAEPFPLEALFGSLGIDQHDDVITFRDDAPLAWIRHAITKKPSQRK